MHNCIFSGHCTEFTCDQSCTVLAETSYLLERNNLNMNSKVFKLPQSALAKAKDLLAKSQGKLACFITKDSIRDGDIFTYVSICNSWKGSRLHCVTYHLKYSQYVDMIKQSWSSKYENESLEYMKIWAESSNTLIISSLDYVSFKDFESQTLLSLLQLRSSRDLTTIVVCPSPNTLIGQGPFADRLRSLLTEASKL